MSEQETEAVTEVTGEQDDYLSYDTAYINEKLLAIDNKLSDISAKFDVMNGAFTDYTGNIGNNLTEFSEQFTVINGVIEESRSSETVFSGALSIMLGLIAGILIIGKYWK